MQDSAADTQTPHQHWLHVFDVACLLCRREIIICKGPGMIIHRQQQKVMRTTSLLYALLGCTAWDAQRKRQAAVLYASQLEAIFAYAGRHTGGAN